MRLLLPVSILLLLACAGGKADKDDDEPGLFEDKDGDDDGYVYDDDCNDDVASVNPGAPELCDPGDVDEDCNGLADNADPGLTDGITAWPDRDGDGFGDPAEPTMVCELIAGYALDATDCDDADPDAHPGGVEVCDDDDRDEDCDGGADNDDPDGAVGEIEGFRDEDGDSYGAEAGQVCDLRDGWVSLDDDCDDGTAEVHPSAEETCNDVDDDCDGDTDEGASDADTWYRDNDRDGYGSTSSTTACDQPSGYVSTTGDCDDADSTAHPGGTETCDDADDDCDGTVDDSAGDAPTWYPDSDGDGYGVPSGARVQCDQPAGYAANDDDCNDGNAGVSPGDAEACDSADVDEDCDGLADDADSAPSGRTTWYRDADADGYGYTSSTTSACNQPSGYVTTSGDCNDGNTGISPGDTEVCDASNTDEDCDGRSDDSDSSVSAATKSTWANDYDRDGYASSAYGTYSQCDSPGSGYTTTLGDCVEFDPDVNPGAIEVCGGGDDDCDGYSDEDDPSLEADTFYVDTDGDGYGDPDGASRVECGAPSGYGEGTDCDDGDADIHPGGAEACLDGVDGDCDGVDSCGISISDAQLAITDGTYSFGTSAAMVGDVDGDGVDDFAVGDQADGTGLGGVYLFSGAATGTLASSGALRSTTVASRTYSYGGWAMVSVPDVSGDGRADLWVGAYNESVSGTYYDGAAYLLDGASLSQLARVTGESGNGYFGISLADLGDWDGDGDDDVAIGAAAFQQSAGGLGSIYVLDADQSGTLGIASAAHATLFDASWRAQPGGNICNVGDMDGDGFADLGLSADWHASSTSFVVHPGADTGDIDVSGDPRVTNTSPWRCGGGDVDGDGYSDATLEDYSAGSRAYLLPGPMSGSARLSAAAQAYVAGTSYSAGRPGMYDIDGDGGVEWIVGMSYNDGDGRREAGQILMFQGALSGALTDDDAVVVINGNTPSGAIGAEWAVGDLDGDGAAEIVTTSQYTYGAWLVSLADFF